MNKTWISFLQVDLPAAGQRSRLDQVAIDRNWGLALLLTGWLHLAAFGVCYYLTIVVEYHQPAGYLAVWFAEILGMWAVFRICAGPRSADNAPQSLERFVCRVWIAYFILAFNLGSMNTLRGHELFELFPAMAVLASFSFIMMTLVLNQA